MFAFPVRDELCTVGAYALDESKEYMSVLAVSVAKKPYLVYVLIELTRKYTSSKAEGVFATNSLHEVTPVVARQSV